MSQLPSEELQKSIDAMIDELFAEDVEKSIDIAKDSKTTADAAVNQAPKAQDAKHPVKQISDVPAIDQDGKRAGEFDKDISEDKKEEENEEAKKQCKESNQVNKSEEETTIAELTKSERDELESFRKEKADREAEEFRKAEVQKQEDLIKSVIEKVQVRYEAKIEELQKSLKEQADLVKAIADAPRTAKSITNIAALEKSQKEESQESFSKSEMLDKAEQLCKAGKLKIDHVIELENNGYIFDKDARETLERELAKN